jgi:RNA polymerase sigma-70 factor (ECF subfamily)
MTDQELIEGLLTHDRTAIHTLVDKYQKKVIKTAYYFLQNMEDAEDLSQDIFIDILDSSQRFRKASTLSTWIYRITVNKSLNLVKKNRRKKIFHSLQDYFDKKPNDSRPIHNEPVITTSPLEENERREILNNAIQSLPENQKIAFILCKYEELSYKEIAEIMNMSLSSVESLIHRAKLNLQKRLATHFSEYIKK